MAAVLQPVATRRRAESNSIAGRLKVGVHADPGGCGHMEDMSVVHQSASAEAPGFFAFCCVYDGHGGTGAARFCVEQLHFNVIGSAHFRRNEMPEALRSALRSLPSADALRAYGHEHLLQGYRRLAADGARAVHVVALNSPLAMASLRTAVLGEAAGPGCLRAPGRASLPGRHCLALCFPHAFTPRPAERPVH